jgi:Domain of unknown function (DUF1735)/Domain of unknown function (DUF4361)
MNHKMKKYHKILGLLMGVSLMFTSTSCLKDEERFTDFAGVGAIAEIPSSAFYGIIENQSFTFSTKPVGYSFDVNIASPSTLSQSVDVTVGVDAAALKKYNDANKDDPTKTPLEVLPTTGYTIVNSTVTVPAGKRLGSITINFNTDKIDASKSYALPISIKTATNGVVVSSNYSTKILAVKIKNIYEGDYSATGLFTHPVLGPRKINRPKTLQTVNGTTVETEFADLGGSGWTMQLVVNADNTVKLVPTGAANQGTTQFGVNKYDPAKKTFTLNYQYSGGGGFRVINETLTLN